MIDVSEDIICVVFYSTFYDILDTLLVAVRNSSILVNVSEDIIYDTSLVAFRYVNIWVDVQCYFARS